MSLKAKAKELRQMVSGRSNHWRALAERLALARPRKQTTVGPHTDSSVVAHLLWANIV